MRGLALRECAPLVTEGGSIARATGCSKYLHVRTEEQSLDVAGGPGSGVGDRPPWSK